MWKNHSLSSVTKVYMYVNVKLKRLLCITAELSRTIGFLYNHLVREQNSRLYLYERRENISKHFLPFYDQMTSVAREFNIFENCYLANNVQNSISHLYPKFSFCIKQKMTVLFWGQVTKSLKNTPKCDVLIFGPLHISTNQFTQLTKF